MSQVGPITPTAAQLLGLTTENLNAAADRRVQMSMASARNKLEADIAKQQIDNQTKLTEMQLQAEKEIAAGKQEGFDKQRAFQGEQAELDRQARTQELDAQFAQQEAMFAKQAALEEDLIGQRAEADKNLLELQRSWEQADLQEDRELVAQYAEQTRAARDRIRKIDEDLFSVNTTVGMLNAPDGVLDSIAAEFTSKYDTLREGMTAYQYQLNEFVKGSTQNVLTRAVADQEFRRNLKDAMRTGNYEFLARDVATQIADTIGGRLERDNPNANAAVQGFVRALWTEDMLTPDQKDDIYNGQPISANLKRAITFAEENGIDKMEMGMIVDTILRFTDATGEGADLWASLKTVESGGKKMKLEGLTKKQTEAFEDVFKKHIRVQTNLDALGIRAPTPEDMDTMATAFSRSLRAVSALDPNRALRVLEGAKQSMRPEDYDKLVSSLEQITGSGEYQEGMAATARQRELQQQRRGVVAEVEEAGLQRDLLGLGADAE